MTSTTNEPHTNRLKFQKTYFIAAVLLFLTEVLIALFVHDQFVRPSFGDYLVVILIYCALKSFLNIPVLPTAIFVLIFSYFVEMLQYFNAVGYLGLQNSTIAKTVLGTSFQWSDLIAYTLGIVTILWIEKRFHKHVKKRNETT